MTHGPCSCFLPPPCVLVTAEILSKYEVHEYLVFARMDSIRYQPNAACYGTPNADFFYFVLFNQYQGVRSEVKTANGGRKVGVVTIKVFSKDTFEDVR